MELPVTDIPPDFIKATPHGFRLVEVNGKKFLLVVSVFCPRGHNLIVNSVRIHGEASIKLKMTVDQSSGFVFIDAFWGSHSKLFSFIPKSDDPAPFAEAFCPYCDHSLMETYRCAHPDCDSDRGILLLLPGVRNKIHVCATLGCPGHKLDITELPNELLNSVDDINYFGAGEDDIFGGI